MDTGDDESGPSLRGSQPVPGGIGGSLMEGNLSGILDIMTGAFYTYVMN